MPDFGADMVRIELSGATTYSACRSHSMKKCLEARDRMGEIRVKVLLTNSMDEALQRRKKLKKDQVRRYEADALVDTGAVRSVIPAHVMERLGLMSRGQRVAEYADGRKEQVAITEPIVFDILGRNTLEEALVLGDEVLIGQTVL
jgi:predicted aspartyl protease